MVKFRLIPTILLNDYMIVQSFRFQDYLPIGNVETAIEFFNNWDVDEIVLLDMMATRQDRLPNIDIIEKASVGCFVPLTFGGGIKTVDHIRNIIRAGADKVVIGAEAVKNPNLIQEGADKFGDQCITISIDYKINKNNEPEVFIINGQVATGLHPLDLAKKVESQGAGEILLYSIDRDGSRMGYDLDMIKSVSDAVRIPVIACGGVGLNRHFVDGIQEGQAQAVAAGNIFNHTEHSTIQAKAHMKQAGLDIRLSSVVNYEDFDFDPIDRAY